ncbi:hypothetical protein [Romboutsia sp. 1001713B170131_170501_G6]|nr:hypothetical protein [Romboutsia sp. 1001713B170131_170501_G6]
MFGISKKKLISNYENQIEIRDVRIKKKCEAKILELEKRYLD